MSDPTSGAMMGLDAASNVYDTASSIFGPWFGTSYRFEVRVGDYDLGSWSKCEGLSVDLNFIRYRAGMNPMDHTSTGSDKIWLYRGRSSYDDIKLTRPVSDLGLTDTAAWLTDVQTAPTPSTGYINMLDANLRSVWVFQIYGVLPSKWTGPTMDVDSGKVATEQLVLCHEGWTFWT